MGVDDGDRPWRLMPPDEALDAIGSRSDGLSADEAAARLEEYGPNTVREETSVSAWSVLVEQFRSPLIYVLAGALAATLLLQRWSDATVIGLVLVVNGTVGFLQEYRAENAIRALMELVSPKARVRRDGEEQDLPSDQIVPGDVALVGEGDVVPADMRLIEASGLRLNEAALTGESVPSSKHADAMDDGRGGEGSNEEKDADGSGETGAPPPAEIENTVFMGTAVTSGSGVGVVVATGSGTRVGRIAEGIRSAESTRAPIQRRMDRLAEALALGILLIAAVAFGIGLIIGESVQDMFLLAVALAVAAMPAGLPVVMTVALAVGVRRMAKRHAVIRRLPAVETLGSCTVIVSDKTGTLTRNQMTVREIESGGARTRVTGSALSTEGEFIRGDEAIDPNGDESLRMTLLVGVLNSGAEVPDGGGGEEADDEGSEAAASGDPMEIALVVAGAKAGLRRDDLLEQHEQLGEVPFRTERRFSASVHADAEGDGPLVCVKGAPEVVLGMCDESLDADGETAGLDADAPRGSMDDMAASGLRLLAIAVGRGDEAADRVHADEPSGFVLAGVQGLLDPPRDEAVRAVDECHAAGIRVLMVTGDHARTAAAVGRAVHLDRPVRVGTLSEHEGDTPDDHNAGADADADAPEGRGDNGAPDAVEGREFDELEGAELDDVLRRVNVFARFTPEQKLALVRRLRSSGEIVAVTGDGVNDAPALKEADLGAAMGRTGTDVAKEASDMVITDDNFASVRAAVEEGRTAFRNIRMATFFLLSTGAADVLIILGALVARWPLPLLPAQILWCNVVTNGIADVALGFEPGRRSLFRRPPRPPREGVLHKPLLQRLAIVGVWLTAGTLGVFAWIYFVREASLEQARTAALTTLVLFQKVHVFNCRSEDQSIFRTPLLANKVLFAGVLASLAVHVAALYIPWTQNLLSVGPLAWDVWVVISLIALTVIIPNELHKAWLRRRTSADEA